MTASLATVPNVHLATPDCLTEAQAAVWRLTVDSRSADFFGPEQGPMLEEYCRVVVMCRVLAEQVETLMAGGDGKDLERVLRLRDMEAKRLASLATKLRLTNQSRYTPKAAATATKHAGGGKVWQFGAKTGA